MSYYVYIVECKDRSYYTGITWSLKKRLKEHNLEKNTPFTRNKTPVRLVYYDIFRNRKDAAKREKEIKGWRRGKKEKLINSLH